MMTLMEHSCDILSRRARRPDTELCPEKEARFEGLLDKSSRGVEP